MSHLNLSDNAKTQKSFTGSNFAREEKKHLNDKASISFWRNYLADVEQAQAKWKFDDTATSPDSLFTSCFFLTADESKSVHQFAREHAIKVDCVFLYAYFKTLSFFLNSDDVVIGTVFNYRPEKKDEHTASGLYAKVLPFRFQLSQTNSLQAVLSRLSATKMKIRAHRHIPYAHRKLILKSDLFQFGFNFKQSDQIIEQLALADIPFILEVTQQDTFSVKFKAHDNFISQQYLNYFCHYLYVALSNILSGKNELALDAHDYQKVIKDWNATQQPYPHEKTLHQLVEEQVQKTPDATALVYEGKQLTYWDLNQRANQLAHYLLKQYQLNPDNLIGLCLDRNEQMLIAILAVLKSGAAYVPIEPGYPDERLSYILNDTNTEIVLTNAMYQKRIQGLFTCDVVALDDPANQTHFQLQATANPFCILARILPALNVGTIINFFPLPI